MKGMHTGDDAFLYLHKHRLQKEQAEIVDVYPTVLSLMKIPPESDVDGVSLIRE